MKNEVEIRGRRFLSIEDAAAQYECSTVWLYKLARRGKIDGVKYGRKWYFDPKSLDEYFSPKQLTAKETINADASNV